MKLDQPETTGDPLRRYDCITCGKTFLAETPGDQVAISLHRILHLSRWDELSNHVRGQASAEEDNWPHPRSR